VRLSEAVAEALGAAVFLGVLLLIALALFGCSRSAPPTPAVAAPVVIPSGDTDDCDGGVCVGPDCAVPGAMR
jgi:hypothetical protein